MSRSPSMIIIGLSITSSWGNGHATSYRSLVHGLSALGYRISFLERNVPWYAENRDEPHPDGCEVALYESLSELQGRFHEDVKNADAVMVGSYVPEGAEVVRWVLSTARGVKLFYDIDTPVTLGRLAAGDEEYLAAESISSFDAYLSFTGGPVLEVLERQYGARMALPLYCSVDPKRHAPERHAQRFDLGYIGTYSEDREAGLERLLLEPARRYSNGQFIVAGACYPEGKDWPKNVARSVHIAPRDHAAFYASQRFTLNLTRERMRQLGHSPSVRLFEAAACGTTLMSDSWEGLDQLFEPGVEILLVESSAEVLDYIHHLPERERRQIGDRARQRVLSEHTGERRARQLDRYVRALEPLPHPISQVKGGAPPATRQPVTGSAND